MTSPFDTQRQQFVQTLFNRIAGRYDLLNRVISLHLDAHWRRKAIEALAVESWGGFVLDLGTGTGDLAFTAARELRQDTRIFGLDFSLQMLRLAQEKKKRLFYGEKIEYVLGSALNPPFKGEIFDAIMTAFVLRNIPDLAALFREVYRLLRPGAKLVSLDMFPPSGNFFSLLYSLYFYRLVPWMGASLARDRDAYQYLSDSVRAFHAPERISELMQEAGFEKIKLRKFLRGAVCLHIGEKSPRTQVHF